MSLVCATSYALNFPCSSGKDRQILKREALKIGVGVILQKKISTQFSRFPLDNILIFIAYILTTITKNPLPSVSKFVLSGSLSMIDQVFPLNLEC